MPDCADALRHACDVPVSNPCASAAAPVLAMLFLGICKSLNDRDMAHVGWFRLIGTAAIRYAASPRGCAQDP